MIANSIVLAGGKGLRLGRDKALVELDGENLLQRVISRLSFLNSDIILIVAEKQHPLEIAGYPKLKVVTDIYPGKGPLVGIYSGLLSSDSAYNLVVACDMPFLNKHLIGYMLDVSAGDELLDQVPGFRVEGDSETELPAGLDCFSHCGVDADGRAVFVD